MMTKPMIGAAIGALIATGALAQAPSTPPAANPAPPAAAQPAAKPATKPDFVATQKPDQWLASKFKGTTVMDADSQKIGTVSDILFDKDGKIEAYVVAVGGFLGMGAKDIALAPTSFEVIPGKNGNADILKISLKQEELKMAQDFTPYSRPHPTTTGSGAPGGLNSLSGGGMKPSGGAPPGR
ncbi:MAG TPA: PRC-barrel domain-containing protein [Pseudolabrys sp.]|nr:PRC-barrel domain-containing protein [Pseudolabrys sp.]